MECLLGLHISTGRSSRCGVGSSCCWLPDKPTAGWVRGWSYWGCQSPMQYWTMFSQFTCSSCVNPCSTGQCSRNSHAVLVLKYRNNDIHVRWGECCEKCLLSDGTLLVSCWWWRLLVCWQAQLHQVWLQLDHAVNEQTDTPSYLTPSGLGGSHTQSHAPISHAHQSHAPIREETGEPLSSHYLLQRIMVAMQREMQLQFCALFPLVTLTQSSLDNCLSACTHHQVCIQLVHLSV